MRPEKIVSRGIIPRDLVPFFHAPFQGIAKQRTVHEQNCTEGIRDVHHA